MGSASNWRRARSSSVLINVNSNRNSQFSQTVWPVGTVQTRTTKVGPARIFKCTPVVCEECTIWRLVSEMENWF